MTQQEMPKMYNTREAGEYLGLSSPRQHVNQLYRRGKFPDPFMVLANGQRYWTKKQLDQFKEGRGKR